MVKTRVEYLDGDLILSVECIFYMLCFLEEDRGKYTDTSYIMVTMKTDIPLEQTIIDFLFFKVTS